MDAGSYVYLSQKIKPLVGPENASMEIARRAKLVIYPSRRTLVPKCPENIISGNNYLPKTALAGHYSTGQYKYTGSNA